MKTAPATSPAPYFSALALQCRRFPGGVYVHAAMRGAQWDGACAIGFPHPSGRTLFFVVSPYGRSAKKSKVRALWSATGKPVPSVDLRAIVSGK